jgi:uncharacterized protein (TIGR02246 family)
MRDTRRRHGLVVAKGLLLGAMIVAAGAAQARMPSDVAKIEALEQEQAQAWSAHDADRYARLFTEDADVVNVLGWHWKGRAELERKLSRAFALVFARSQLSVHDVGVRFLKPDVAIAHVPWTMTGALSPTGGTAPPQQGLQTQTLVKRDGRWGIAAFQNTNAVPEREFPIPK